MGSRSFRIALAALASMALAACGDRAGPTGLAAPAAPRATSTSGSTPTITALTLARDSAFIGGTPVSFTATLNNPGASVPGIAIQGWVRQGSALRAAGGTAVFCGSGTGVLPTGNCTVNFSYGPSNTAGGVGTLIPGPATFELQLEDSVGTVVDSVSVPVTLLPNHPIITAIDLSRDSAFIDGPTTPFTATLENPNGAHSGVAIQGWIVQGSVTHAANGTVVNCGSGTGVLPTGICTVSFELSASNNGLSGPGTLLPGVATFELQLEDSVGAVVDTRSVPITLIPDHPLITAIDLSPDSAFIDGRITPYTATIENPDGTHSGVVIQGFIVQGSVNHAAGGTVVGCGSGDGVLPTGICTASFGLSANNSGLSGPGTLVPGAAIFVLQLKDSVGNVVHSVGVPITLLPNTPRITDLTLSSTTVMIEGSSVPFTATFDNPGLNNRSGASFQGWIVQGTTRRAANGALVDCGSGAGVLPTNGCTVSWELSASNTAGGTGTLVAGNATFELDLRDSVGGVWDSKTVAIKLVAPSVSITALTLSTDTAVIEGAGVSYSVTINNPGGTQNWVEIVSNVLQGTAKRAAGTFFVNCGGLGVLSTGSCTQLPTFSARNSSSGTGTLVAGPATLEVNVFNALTGKVLATRTTPIVLANP